MRIETLPLSRIEYDLTLSPRVLINEEAVTDYRLAYQRGDNLPRIRVFLFDGVYWLTRGFHRYPAALQAGLKELEVEVCEGARIDAKLDAMNDNHTHGVRYTNYDKRRMVDMLLDDPWSADKTPGQIAAAAGVSVVHVRNVQGFRTGKTKPVNYVKWKGMELEMEARQREIEQAESQLMNDAYRQLMERTSKLTRFVEGCKKLDDLAPEERKKLVAEVKSLRKLKTIRAASAELEAMIARADVQRTLKHGFDVVAKLKEIELTINGWLREDWFKQIIQEFNIPIAHDREKGKYNEYGTNVFESLKSAATSLDQWRRRLG
jgi:hypothetical protein